MTLLQILGLALRAEALGVPLRSGGAKFKRSDLHLASGASFLANCFVPVYIGQLVHIAMLQRKTKKTSPAQIIVADSTVFYSEMVIFAVFVVFLVSSLPWGSLPLLAFLLFLAVVAIAVFLITRAQGYFFWSRPLQVFSDKKGRIYFFFLVIAIVVIQPLRFWLLFQSLFAESTVKYSLLAWIGSSIAQVLPIGPGPAIVAGTLAVTPLSFATATLTGIVFEGTFLLAALFYLALTEVWSLLSERRERKRVREAKEAR